MRRQHRCPFVNEPCNKQSRLISYPMGVCSAYINGHAVAICPRRFLEGQTVFRNLVRCYQPAFTPGSSNMNVFAVYDLVRGMEAYVLTLQRFASSSVDALFTALRQNPNVPEKDQFVAKLQARMEQQQPHLHLSFDH